MRQVLQLAVSLLLLSAAGWAGDGTRPGYEAQWQAHLRNGFSIQHCSHEIVGPSARLWLTPGKSYVDVATDEIVGFEAIEIRLQAPPPAPAPPVPRTLSEVVSDAGQRTRIDPDFIASVIHAESGGNPRAVSPKGARGLMQLMPQTASRLGVTNAFDPKANVDGGSRYLATLLEQYHGDAQKALAAYNAGPHGVEQYRGVPPYRETRSYVARVINDFNRRKAAQQPAKHTAKRRVPAAASGVASIISDPSL